MRANNNQSKEDLFDILKMKINWLTKKLGESVVGMVFVVYSLLLFSKSEYGLGVVLVLALLILLKLDVLTELAFSMSGGVHAKFQTSSEKIEEDIKENEELVTDANFASFKHIETKILVALKKRYGGEMKTLIHYLYGQVDKPEFRYTPDGSLLTKDTLYLFEIKYVLKPEFAEKIVNNTAAYLKTVYDRLSPSMGDKRLVMKLILASSFDLNVVDFTAPEGVELELYRV